VSDLISVLVVEDEPLIAMDLAERLADMGYVVLGPADTVGAAEALVADKTPDIALLDSGVAGQSSTPLAAALAARGVAVGFCTGLDKIKDLPPELREAPVLTKPISDASLVAALKRLLP